MLSKAVDKGLLGEALEGPQVSRDPVVIRIRNEGDMDHLKGYLVESYGRRYRQAEREWAETTSAESERTETLVKKQKTPFKISRWLLLLLFLIVTFIRGSTYWGWTGFQDLLYKSGAYAWTCEGEGAAAENISYQKIGEGIYVDCPARKNAINNLYTIAFAANFIFSAFGGFILDRVGPKITLLGATLLDAAGWCLLSVSSQAFPAYIASFLLIGMATDPGYLALLYVSNLFPRKQSTVMGVMGSCRSLSFSIPVILAAVYKGAAYKETDLWKFLAFYIVVGLGTCLLIGLLFVPLRPFKAAADLQKEEKERKAAELRETSLKSIPASFFEPWAADAAAAGTTTAAGHCQGRVRAPMLG